MKDRYRIVQIGDCWFKVEIKRRWSMSWRQIGGRYSSFVNNNPSLESAKELIELHRSGQLDKIREDNNRPKVIYSE